AVGPTVGEARDAGTASPAVTATSATADLTRRAMKFSLGGQALERQYRMQLDLVRRDPGLVVEEVEEGDACDLRLRAEGRCRSGLRHLIPPVCGRRGVTSGVRSLRDHCVAGAIN